MPTTVSAIIYDHFKKKDETYNVKIRLSHKRKRTFINTQHYVSKRQIDKELNITDEIINSALNKTLDAYRQTISKLGSGLFTLSCEDLKNLLKNNSSL